MGLCARGYHRRKPTYGQPKPIKTAVRENLLNREFNQERIDEIWVTDITYISCSDGRLYLSTYIDLTRRIPRCFAIEQHMRKSIVLNPLASYPGKLPKMIHSDRGSQYRSYYYQELLEEYAITHSMSEPGTPVVMQLLSHITDQSNVSLLFPTNIKPWQK